MTVHDTLTNVALAKELHPHDSKDKDDDAKHEGQVSQGPNRFAHD